MYRVVIVDDEEPVLDSFSFILEKESEDFSLCGKARSGTEAVRLINEVKPDVVFMDIQIPGIDGIDAITEIRSQYPEIVFILATAYERFDLAQRAIPLGVFSYLVKPISRKALVGELQRVKLHLEQTRRRSNRQLQDIRFLQKTREEVKNKLIGGLAWGSPSSEDWELFSQLFSLKSERGTVCVAQTGEELSDEARAALFGTLREKIQFKFNCFHSMLAGRLVFFFPEDQSLDRLDSHIRNVTRELQPVEIEIGRGGTYHYSRLADSFSEAISSLEGSENRRGAPLSEKEEMQRICTAMLRSDFGRGIPLFEDFWMRSFRDHPFEVAKAKMVALFTLLWDGIDSRLLAANRIDFNPAEVIMPLGSVEEWRSWSSETLRSLERLLKEPEARRLPPHLAKALSLVHSKFNEPIQLSSIAEECQISASYLCRLFSEHLGTSFVEYLTRYRIDRAMLLLRDDRCSVKETSGLVGFQDPNYFSRVFRRYVGLSPSELAGRRGQ